MIHRLHPHLRHAIVNELGWRALRPVQEQTIEAVLDGDNAVVLAPTAGGKTEAAVFPVLSQIIAEERRPVSALYVCPIRALLNNQEPRLRAYARMVGLDVFKWHGDVAATRKDRFCREPAHLLLITPESLEVLLIGRRAEAQLLFAALGTVIIDEVHAFAGDDRGAHLAALLERISLLAGRDLQRIGLSATVGNPRGIAGWLQGSSRRPVRLVDPPRPPFDPALRVAAAGGVESAAHGIAGLARGRKSLVFVESRAQAEKVAQALDGRGVEVFVHHSSVSRADRQRAEEQFAGGSNTAIVCTSTMELGIDVGDLDQVFQVDAPSTVASLLQRLGRAGRRPGTRPHGTFFCLSPEALLQAVALLRLAIRGWVEDVVPPRRAAHVLAHQVLALTLQEGGLSRHRILSWLDPAAPFVDLDEAAVQAVVDTMVGRGILHEADGLLSLGCRGEELYGRRHFFELYAVFSSTAVLRVVHGLDEVGLVQAGFVQGQDGGQGPLCFRLAGRSWRVTRVEWRRGRVLVVPAEEGRVPTWLGRPAMLPFALCQEMRRTLTAEEGAERDWLDPPARAWLGHLREDYEGLLATGSCPVEADGEGVRWHTFAGGGANRVLAAALAQTTDTSWVAGNLSLRAAGLSVARAAEGIGRLHALDLEAVAAGAASGFARGQVSKFQPCLPPEAEARLLAEALLDVRGAAAVVAGGGTRRPGGRVACHARGTPIA